MSMSAAAGWLTLSFLAAALLVGPFGTWLWARRQGLGYDLLYYLGGAILGGLSYAVGALLLGAVFLILGG